MDWSLPVFWVMMIVFGTALFYPWHPNWPGAKWLIHFPLLLLPLWGIYEAVLPGHMNIRLDLILIIWALGFTGVVYALRLLIFFLLRREAR